MSVAGRRRHDGPSSVVVLGGAEEPARAGEPAYLERVTHVGGRTASGHAATLLNQRGAGEAWVPPARRWPEEGEDGKRQAARQRAGAGRESGDGRVGSGVRGGTPEREPVLAAGGPAPARNDSPGSPQNASGARWVAPLSSRFDERIAGGRLRSCPGQAPENPPRHRGASAPRADRGPAGRGRKPVRGESQAGNLGKRADRGRAAEGTGGGEEGPERAPSCQRHVWRRGGVRASCVGRR